MAAEFPVVAFGSRDELAAWLDTHHGDADGVWIKFAKKSSGIASATYPEAVELALMYGWIDGQSKSVDAEWYLQKFTPRRARSRWSQINCARAEALIAAGRMQPAGLAEVERAKADGRWDAAYAPPSTATVPDDLRAALDGSPAARDAFAGLSGRNRYAILHRIGDAKRPDTRARRIAKYVEMLERGETPS